MRVMRQNDVKPVIFMEFVKLNKKKLVGTKEQLILKSRPNVTKRSILCAETRCLPSADCACAIRHVRLRMYVCCVYGSVTPYLRYYR